MTEIDRLILKHLQDIPVVEEPFKKISQSLGISTIELIDRICQLKEDKIIRQISPIYDTKSLGYDSSLVAFRVEGDVQQVAQVINNYPGVSHNYERTDEYNLWFTIAVPPDSRLGLEQTVEILAKQTGVEDYLILRTKKLFKIGVKLDYENLKEKESIKTEKKKESNLSFHLSSEDKKIISVTQEDIPLTERPFEVFSQTLGIDQQYLLDKLNTYKSQGLMRRFAAILFHRKAGFTTNGMVVWRVPEERIEEVGIKLASYKAVSHCYHRETSKNWHYNLFSMIHAKSQEDLEDFVKELSQEVEVRDFKILYSTREFKKKRIKYFSEEFYRWEEDVKDGKYSAAGIKS
ncbi:Lrp/AsnC family transcriptional regulator [Persephonella atlantica]|uniref:siroheme decarboxylase n=1 Tax=Persephonella atlantica TaxID=2699429 RepID=A0ABS1GGT4_9AQUI|nr:Lrp/AsnC family transcriptional regulator [Persephonella atlantica]MBK3332031.1 Lrp/AsnC family transcriptional regulator [Persephonella atlantica]